MKKKLLGEADLTLAMATEKAVNEEKAAKEADQMSLRDEELKANKVNSYSKEKRTSKLQHKSPVRSVITCIKYQLKVISLRIAEPSVLNVKGLDILKKIVDLIVLTVLENPLIMLTMLMMMVIHFA